MASPSSGAPRRFMLRFQSPEALQNVGPIAAGTWSVPAALATALTAAGLPVPPVVGGFFLIDTGAHRTAISSAAAAALQLNKIGTTTGFGAHGEQESDKYRAMFSLAIQDGTGVVEIRQEMDVIAIPQLTEMFARFGLKDGTGRPVTVIGLLGRDFLRHCRMRYDGPGGYYEIEVDFSSITTQVPPVSS